MGRDSFSYFDYNWFDHFWFQDLQRTFFMLFLFRKGVAFCIAIACVLVGGY